MGNIFDDIDTKKPAAKSDSSSGNMFTRMEGEKREPAPSLSAAIAAAGATGAANVLRNRQGQAIDEEGHVIDEPKEEPLRGAQNRGFVPRAEDYLTRLGSSLQLGFGEKLAATGPGRWLARAGKTDIRDLAQGKLAADTTEGMSYDEVLAKRRAETGAAGERLGTEGALAADLGGGLLTGSTLGRLGLTVAGRVPAAASLGTKVAAGAAEGAGYGAAYGAGHTDTGNVADYVKNMITDGGIGLLAGGAFPAVARGVQRLITPLVAGPQRQAAVDTLRDAGVTNISAGQATQSPRLRYLEDVGAKMVGGRDPTGNAALGNQQMQQATQAVMERAGIPRVPGQLATTDVMEDAFRRTGGQIRNIQQQYPVQVDARAAGDAVDILNNVLPRLQQDQRGPIQHYLRRFLGGQQLDPDVAQAMRTDLNKDIRGASGPLKEAYIAVKDALDNALERTIAARGNHGDNAALRQARQHYANLNVLADGLASSGAAGAEGVLTPPALHNALKANIGRADTMRGRGDLNDLARSIASTLKSPPDSGTYTRSSIRDVGSALSSIGVMRPFIGSRPAQAYWGNQALNGPGVEGGIVANAAQMAATPSIMGPADRIMQGLLAGQ